MNIDGIRLFVLTARHLTITQAARELHIGQPAASRQLKRLQEELGIKFLERHGRGIKLTQPGRTFLKEISPICLQLEALQKSYARTQESLTIAGSHSASAHLLPPLIAEFNKKYPAVRVTVPTGTSAEMEELLLAWKADLAITTQPAISSRSSFAVEVFHRKPLTAFVAANHPLVQKKSVHMSELRNFPLVVRIRRDGQSTAEAQLNRLAKEGLKFRIAMRFESPELVKEAVRYGAGVGLLYYDVIQRELDHGEFKAIRLAGLDAARQSYIVYSKEKPLSSWARQFLSVLRASASKELPIETKVLQVLKRGYGDHGRVGILQSKLS